MTDATPAAQPVPDVDAASLAPAASPSPESAPANPEPLSPPPAAEEAKPAPGAEPTTEVKTAEPTPDAPKVETSPPVEGEAKPEVAAEAPKPDAPKYEFKMPDGVTAEAPIMSAYENILGKYSMTPEAGQELLDFHATQIKDTVARVVQQQQDDYAKTRQGWVKDFEKQSGNRRDTVLNDAKWAVTQFGGDKKQVAELWDVLNMTGAGDHPATIRAFANVAKAMRERSAPQHGAPVTTPADPATRRYGKARA